MIEKLNYIRELLRTKFVGDSLFTIISTVFIGLFGILNNIIITRYFGPDGLGGFNLAISIYTILVYLSVLGINNSVVKNCTSINQKYSQNEILSNSILIVLLLSLVIVLLSYLMIPFLSLLFNNAFTIEIIPIFIFTLPLFSINKVLLAFLNSQRRMIEFSIIQSSRFVLVFIIILIIYSFDGNIKDCAFSIFISEIIIFLMLLFPLKLNKYLSFRISPYWFKKHFEFGFPTFLSDFLIDLYYKSDMIILGIFVSPYYLGIYSFASEVAKGLSMLGSVFQINFNPIITKLWEKSEFNELKLKLKLVKNTVYIIYLPIIIASSIIYVFVVKILTPELDVQNNYLTFSILLLGVYIYSGYQAILGVLTYSGYVNYQLKRSLYTFLMNIILNIVFIKLWGTIGAAISTSISLIFSVILIIIYKNKIFYIKSNR